LSLKIAFENGVLKFKGKLDEFVNPDDMIAVYNLHKEQLSGPNLTVDLSGVRSCNSMGIVIWIRFMNSVTKPFIYINAPIWLIYQFGMISDLLKLSSKVESLQVPFYCEETDTQHIEVLKIGTDIPRLEDYKNFEMAPIQREGHTYIFDVVPAKYFAFLTKRVG
jgi:hypothetical protein